MLSVSTDQKYLLGDSGDSVARCCQVARRLRLVELPGAIIVPIRACICYFESRLARPEESTHSRGRQRYGEPHV